MTRSTSLARLRRGTEGPKRRKARLGDFVPSALRSPRAERSAAFAIVALVLLVPLAEGHITGARPILQRSQFPRLPDIQPDGLALRTDLVLRNDDLSDPLRHLVTHEIDPTLGKFFVEYRADASVPEERFYAQWRFERLLEYRDANVDGRFQPATDTAVKAWRFTHYGWSLDAIQTVAIADVQGTSAVWSGNLTGAPSMRWEVAIAGRDFSDEGAVVRAQDVALYWDVQNIPERELGSLYALEATITVQRDTVLSFHVVENTSTALLADGDLRRALLVWGGEGFLDGQEQRLEATIEDERVEGENKTARFVLHMPTVDEAMRFVMVSALEYGSETKRGPLSPVVLVAAVGIGALLLRRRAA